MKDKTALDVMAEGCVNHRVRIVFWDPSEQEFTAVTPEQLLEFGAPYNSKTEQYLEYNSTHLTTA